MALFLFITEVLPITILFIAIYSKISEYREILVSLDPTLDRVSSDDIIVSDNSK
jgi:hypothetical protein